MSTITHYTITLFLNNKTPFIGKIHIEFQKSLSSGEKNKTKHHYRYHRKIVTSQQSKESRFPF